MILREFEKGECFARKGKPLRSLYIVLTGTAMCLGKKTQQKAGQGAELCAHMADYQNALSEMTIVAETEMTVATFSRADFDAVQAGCLGNDMLSRADFLGKLPMFTHYDQETLLEMAQMCIHQVFPYDQQIVEQNEELRGLYLILTGTVRRERAFDVPETVYNHVTKEWQPTGKRDRSTLDLGLLYPGSYFGDAAITETTTVGRSPTRITAMSTPVECLLLPRICRLICDEKALQWMSLMKPNVPTDKQIQGHREYEKYWNKYKRDCVEYHVWKND